MNQDITTNIMEIPRVDLFGIRVHELSFAAATKLVLALLDETEQRCRTIFTPNINHLVLANRVEAFRRAYHDASLVLPDGRYVILMSRLLGRGLIEPVNGSDLVPALLRNSESRGGLRLFLLGAQQGVAAKAASRIEEEYPWVTVVGYYSPPMDFQDSTIETARILKLIGAARPELLVLGISPPKQEVWIHENIDSVSANVSICAGATIDFLAGVKPRAPVLLQRLGMEWVYRVLTEPRRLAPRYFKDGLSITRMLAAELMTRVKKRN